MPGLIRIRDTDALHVSVLVHSVSLQLLHGSSGLMRIVKLNKTQIELVASLARLTWDHPNRLVTLHARVSAMVTIAAYVHGGGGSRS